MRSRSRSLSSFSFASVIRWRNGRGLGILKLRESYPPTPRLAAGHPSSVGNSHRPPDLRIPPVRIFVNIRSSKFFSSVLKFASRRKTSPTASRNSEVAQVKRNSTSSVADKLSLAIRKRSSEVNFVGIACKRTYFSTKTPDCQLSLHARTTPARDGQARMGVRGRARARVRAHAGTPLRAQGVLGTPPGGERN